jgi:hypothetical protein
MNQVIIFNKINGIEFYTDINSGRSGISLAGLSRLCFQSNISIRIRYIFNQLKHGKLKLEGIHQDINEYLLIFNHVTYVDDRLSKAIIQHLAEDKNIATRETLIEILCEGFNEWVAQITGWKKKYRRFENNASSTNYQDRMETAYQLVRDKAFLESCLTH